MQIIFVCQSIPKTIIQWLVNIQTRELIAKGKGDVQKAKQYRQANKDKIKEHQDQYNERRT